MPARATQFVNLLALLLLSVGFLARPLPARAQAEWSRWYFGATAGLRFTADSAVVLRDGRMMTSAACATVSDSAGRLLLYSNGRRVWNGRHQVLANGAALGGDSLSAQGCSLVPNPRQRGRYYLFTLDSWHKASRRGLRLAELDVRAASGQGQVLSVNQPVVPDTLLQRLGNHDFMEVQALVRHPNGRDYWLVTHLLDTNLFVSVRITGQGFPRSAVVVSAAGMVRTLLPGNANSLADLPGMLAVAPSGRRLALISQINGAEVFDFDPATGQVSNPIRLNWGVYSVGAAFSPSGKLLYISRQGPAFVTGTCALNAITEVRQFDVSLPTAAAVVASGTVVYTGCGYQVWGLQRAPNGRIYAANQLDITHTTYATALDVIQKPDVPGPGCQYTVAGIDLGTGRWVGQQLPVVPNEPPQSRLQALQLAAGTCAGQAVQVSLAGVTLGAAGDTLDWNFGDGSTLRTQLPQATHTYAAAGTYQVVVRLRNRPLGVAEQLSGSITVSARPSLSLGPDLRLCAGATAQLSVGSLPAGTTVRWHDGSTAPTHAASAPGIYWAELTAGAGCTARDSVVVRSAPLPTVTLAADQPLCAGGSVVLSPGPQPAGSRYRWQDGSTAASLVASGPGAYSVAVTSPEGCVSQGALTLRFGSDCPFQLPSIITPNDDAHNELFVLQGLNAAEWQVTIYNRWGRLVFEQAHYDNHWNAAGQSAGIYYYVLQNATTGQRLKGWLEVVK